VAKPVEVTDDSMRQDLVDAEKALDEGDFPAAVHNCVAAYSRLALLRPDMVVAPPRFGHVAAPPQLGRPAGPPGGGLFAGGPRPWPSDHGVRLDFGPNQQPALTFTKDRFTLSEAATYFEYTLDIVLRAQRNPAPA